MNIYKKKLISIFLLITLTAILLSGCDLNIDAPSGTQAEVNKTQDVADKLANNQSTPTDIDYSLERYNLTKRAYWVNGQREKAMSLPCAIERPLGYVILFTNSGGIVGKFVVDGKISSLNSYLSPNYIEDVFGRSSSGYTTINTELPDVDGSYGSNDNGIFFFDVSGKYIEWNGTYLYSDIPFEVENPIVTYEAN